MTGWLGARPGAGLPRGAISVPRAPRAPLAPAADAPDGGAGRGPRYSYGEPDGDPVLWAADVREYVAGRSAGLLFPDRVAAVFTKAFAPRTREAYNVAWRRWQCYCEERDLGLFEAGMWDAMDFVVWLLDNGIVGMRTVPSYLSAVNRAYGDLQRPLPAPKGSAVHHFVRELERREEDANRPPPQLPLPARVAKRILDHALKLVGADGALEAGALPRARACLAVVVGFMSGSRPISLRTLPIDGIEIDGDAVVLRRTDVKTARGNSMDQAGRWAIYLRCPAPGWPGLVRAFVRARGSAPRFFFALAGEGELSTYQPPQWLRLALSLVQETAPPHGVWTPRSLRLGLASACSALRVPHQQIQQLGGWKYNSSAMAEVYIRPVDMSPEIEYFFGHHLLGHARVAEEQLLPGG